LKKGPAPLIDKGIFISPPKKMFGASTYPVTPKNRHFTPLSPLRNRIYPNFKAMSEYLKNFSRYLISYSAQKDIPSEKLTALAGIDLAVLKENKKATVSLRQFNDLWQHAIRQSEDPLFGLHFGETLQLAALGIVGAVVRNSGTVGEALQNCVSYVQLMTDLFETKIRNKKNSFTVQFSPNKEKLHNYPVMTRQLMELSLAFVLHELDGLLFTKIHPLLAELPYEEANTKEYERVLRCSALKNGKNYILEFDNAFWKEPIISSNFELQTFLLQKIAELNYRVEPPESLGSRIVGLLRSNTYLGIPSLQEVAANLHISPRSLQRKLRQEGSSYQELAESVRKSMAIHYLNQGGHPMKEISYMLGYNELSAFSRAFKKWTGMAPQEFRRSSAISSAHPH
jgi:AraC-like DNA-binding protein